MKGWIFKLTGWDRWRLFNMILSVVMLLTLFLCLMSPVKADLVSSYARFYIEGFKPMCERIPEECAPYADDRMIVTLTPERAAELKQVNDAVNRDYVVRTDIEHFGKPEYWTYPTDGAGDCEDLAMEKRRRLVMMGWPRRALLLAIVTDSPELHAILALRTDQGTITLDINTAEIKLLDESRLDWIQSPIDPRLFHEGPGLS